MAELVIAFLFFDFVIIDRTLEIENNNVRSSHVVIINPTSGAR